MPVYDKEQIALVKSKVSIPNYFYKIVVPRTGGYYSDGIDFDVRPFVKCCLHDEDTPSMKYYEETNTYHCFGCGSTGTVVDLHMNFMEKQSGRKPSFGESVDFLYKFFIQGNEAEISKTDRVVRKSIIKKDEIEDTSVDKMKFQNYLKAVEAALLKDTKQPIENKIKAWNVSSKYEEMVVGGLVSSREALKELKEEINKI